MKDLKIDKDTKVELYSLSVALHKGQDETLRIAMKFLRDCCIHVKQGGKIAVIDKDDNRLHDIELPDIIYDPEFTGDMDDFMEARGLQ